MNGSAHPAFVASGSPTAAADSWQTPASTAWQSWWLGGSGLEAANTSLEFSYDPTACTLAPTLPLPSADTCVLSGTTSVTRYASSWAGGKFVEFMVNGVWRAPVLWFEHAAYGAVVEKEFKFGGQTPSQVRERERERARGQHPTPDPVHDRAQRPISATGYRVWNAASKSRPKVETRLDLGSACRVREPILSRPVAVATRCCLHREGTTRLLSPLTAPVD